MYIINWTRRHANGIRTSKAKSGGIKIADNRGKFTAKPHSRHSAVMTSIRRAREKVRGMDSLSKVRGPKIKVGQLRRGALPGASTTQRSAVHCWQPKRHSGGDASGHRQPNGRGVHLLHNPSRCRFAVDRPESAFQKSLD